MNIGITIRSLRKAKKIRQRDCAKQVGISETSMNLIETSVTQPRYETVIKIAAVLNVSVATIYFLCLTSEDYKNKEEIKFMISELLKRL